jgi:hypothetical protein
MLREPHSGQKLNLLSFIEENISLCGGKVKGVLGVQEASANSNSSCKCGFKQEGTSIPGIQR